MRLTVPLLTTLLPLLSLSSAAMVESSAMTTTTLTSTSTLTITRTFVRASTTGTSTLSSIFSSPSSTLSTAISSTFGPYYTSSPLASTGFPSSASASKTRAGGTLGGPAPSASASGTGTGTGVGNETTMAPYTFLGAASNTNLGGKGLMVTVAAVVVGLGMLGFQ